MYERKYKVRVFDKSRVLWIKGKEVRTPVEAVVTKEELDLIKISLSTSGSKNYTVEEVDGDFFRQLQEVPNNEVVTLPKTRPVPSYDAVRAKLRNRTVVTNLSQETKLNSPLDPISKRRTKFKSPETSFYIPSELQSGAKEKLLSVDPIRIKKADFDVKIEYLKTESESILRKILSERKE